MCIRDRDQIAALDQLATAQDREKQDAEELRKIEKLRQQIAYEQDDYCLLYTSRCV